MLAVYLSVMILYVFLFLVSMHEKLSEGNRQKKVFFEKGAAYLYRQLSNKRILKDTGIKEKMQLLHPGIGGGTKEKSLIQEFYITTISRVLLFLFVGNLLTLFLFISERTGGVLSDGKYIIRNAYGHGSIEMVLQAKTEKSGGGTETFPLKVEEQQYREAELKQLAQSLKSKLPDLILGDNISLEEVRSNLNLVQEAEGYPFEIEWDSSNYSLVCSDGTIVNEELGESGEAVQLTARLLYQDYEQMLIFPVHILPPLYSKKEELQKKLQKQLVKAEEGSREKKQMELPKSVDGIEVAWSEKKTDDSGYLFLLICICSGLIYALQERNLKERTDARNRQLMLDYPELVSKLTLYMGAGMTIRNAFRKIAFDYRSKREKGERHHYVYEEMLFTCYELDSGISEGKAYESFGRRCRLPQYTKFSSLLTQNLRKGSNSLSEALREEARSALEERRNTARKMGEEAGTKLLFPMMLMLGIVMVLIIIPAYFSFAV